MASVEVVISGVLFDKLNRDAADRGDSAGSDVRHGMSVEQAQAEFKSWCYDLMDRWADRDRAKQTHCYTCGEDSVTSVRYRLNT